EEVVAVVALEVVVARSADQGVVPGATLDSVPDGGAGAPAAEPGGSEATGGGGHADVVVAVAADDHLDVGVDVVPLAAEAVVGPPVHRHVHAGRGDGG